MEGFAQKVASRKLPFMVSSREENDPLGFSHLLMIQHVMSKTQYPLSLWQLLGGIFLAYLGLVLIGCGQWILLPIGSPVFFYAGGFLLCMLGMLLIWKEPVKALITEDEEAPDQVSSEGKTFLGGIELNGYYFEAYEEETADGGKRFRLLSFPLTDPEREAAFIRYLIYEGFVEQRWPRLSRKIKEEASWAFFF
jgi:hypothetical protein